MFKKYYSVGNNKVGVVNVGEKTNYKINTYYEDKEIKKNEMDLAIVNKIIHILKTTDDGAIIVFVKSGGEGNKLCNLLRTETKKLDLYPFCTALSSGSALDKNPITGYSGTNYATKLNLWKNHPSKNESHPFIRKVVMTTNVAESSITIDDAVYVIETGNEFNDRYYPEISARTLKEEYISQGSATQRKGRAGRTAPGNCYFMYTEKQFNEFKPFPTPDIQKSDLSTELIDLLRMDNIQNIKNLKIKLNELIQPPTDEFINSALNKLNQLNLINGITDDCELTILGKMVSKFRGLLLEHTVALIYSYNYFCKKDVIDIISLLITTDSRLDNLFKEPRDPKMMRDFVNKKKQFVSEYGDFFTLLKTYRMYQREQDEINNLNKLEQFNNGNGNRYQSTNAGGNAGGNAGNNAGGNAGGNAGVNAGGNAGVNAGGNADNQIGGLNNENNILNFNNKIVNNIPKRTTKKWCKENYLDDRTLKKIKSNSQKLNRTLNDVMKNKNNLSNIETDLKFNSFYLMDQAKKEINYLDALNDKFISETIHSNIMRALLHGFKINLAKDLGKNYTTCFPLKHVYCNMDMNTTCKKGKFVIYNELFTSGFNYKMNMVTNLTEELIKDKKLDDIFNKCLQRKTQNVKEKELQKKNNSGKITKRKPQSNKQKQYSKKSPKKSQKKPQSNKQKQYSKKSPKKSQKK